LDASKTSAAAREQIQKEKQRLSQAVSAQKLKAGIAEWQTLVLARTEGSVSTEALPTKWTALAQRLGELNDQEIVIRAEILAGMPSPEADQQKRMEIQVQRLTEGMGFTEKTDNALQTVEGLVASWCVKPANEGADLPLANRLNKALDSLIVN
ncbi:MAG: DUF349 domain-containing protein, partial [Marinobacter sp.]